MSRIREIRKAYISLVCLVFSALLALSARAADIQWTGDAGDSKWWTDANWADKKCKKPPSQKTSKRKVITPMTQQEINVMPIYDGPDSTILSWNGTTPESPDGERITYFRQPCPDGSEEMWEFTGAVWVCDRDFTNHRKIFEMPMYAKAFQHNGGMQIWIDNKRLAFRSTGEQFPLETIYIVDVDTQEVLHKPIITGEGCISHRAVNHKLPFGIKSDEEIRQNRHSYPEIDEQGIYVLDCDTGKVDKIISSETVLSHLRSQGYTLIEESPKIAHVNPNYDFTRVMARWVVKEFPTVVSCDPDGGNMIVCPDRPLHILWFDNETYFGADTRRNDPQNETREIFRYTQEGEKIEELAGQSNHLDGSPDRQWFVGDSKGFDWAPPHMVRLFRRGEAEPAAEMGRHNFDYPVMRLKAHANPVFSRDGKRVYWNHMVDQMHALASCADISSIVEADG